MFAAKNELFTRPSGYNLSRSVRYRASASPYFTRPFATPTNSSKWTMSMWAKRGILSSATTPALFGKTISASANFYLAFDPGNTMTWTFSNTAYMTTTQVFRDPSSWYHIVAVWDSANATASQRARLYVNGTEVTAFSVDNRSSITTSMDAWNTTSTAYLHGLGCASATVSTVTQFFDGYLTEVNFIDGQALTPTSFGQFNSVTGVWQPLKYTGTYGNNGFYLNFSDNSAATAAAIGKDYSGNGNNWTPNNISVTSGVTYDSMLDVPTMWADGGNGRGNYCTFNPNLYNAGSVTYSDANLKMAMSSSVDRYNLGTIGVSSGKWYWEIVPSGFSTSSDVTIGICKVTRVANGPWTAFGGPDTINFNTGNGWSVYGSNIGSATGTIASGDVIGVALDMDGNNLYIYKNNVLLTSRSGSIDLTTPHTLFVDTYYTGSSAALNCGQRPFTYTPPSGFVALNTQNLPAPTISNGALYMAATTYTGNGASRSITNGGNNTIGTTFQPDFAWIKSRSNALNSGLMDSVRGPTKLLISNATNAEQTLTDELTSFNSNGFSLGASSNGYTNFNTYTYVAWQWQAGAGTTSSNTSGSITSTVSVNATAGFSVVSFTGVPVNTSTSTIGHGLGVAPSFIILKNRNVVDDWYCQHVSLGASARISLNTTAAAVTSAGSWGNTAPTSTVFTIANNAFTTSTSQNLIAYCFSAVAGYSAFGKYTGNNSSDGPFVYTGFRPRWILFKDSTNAATNWVLQDTSRFTYNVATGGLLANTSASEYSTGYDVDILSNGFKIRRSGGDTNASGATIVYAAFAENPYKLALAR